jgi:hypothetical protein
MPINNLIIPGKLFCSYNDMLSLLQNNLLSCPLKKLTGFNCPLCGLQRSIIALLQGDIISSLKYQPVTIPLLLIFILNLPIAKRFSLVAKPALLPSVYTCTAAIVLINYSLEWISGTVTQ